MDINRFRPTLELVAEVESVTDLDYRVLLTMVRRISREGKDARAAMEALELPVLATEIPFLGVYRGAFGETIEGTGDYEKVAEEILEVGV